VSLTPEEGPGTVLVYQGLPELYRDADPGTGHALLRFLSLVLDQLTPLLDLVARLSYYPLDDYGDLPFGVRYGSPGSYDDGTYDDPGTSVLTGPPPPWRRYGSETYGTETYGQDDSSDLADPTRADEGWLPWLAQLVGVNVTGLEGGVARSALLHPDRSWTRGSTGALIAATRTALENPNADVTIRLDPVGSPFIITVTVHTADLPTGVTADDVAALLAPSRPAGFSLVVTAS
jgi:hypothetical protein